MAPLSPPTSSLRRALGPVALAMTAFAANSLLARLALATGHADAWGYTGLRMLSGAAALALLMKMRGGPVIGARSTWPAAGALFGYALLFSLAYVMLGAAAGALILFASVQIGMIGWSILQHDRPGVWEWLGIAGALGSLGYLMAPGMSAPPPTGAALMAGAGLCWAAYTVLGKGSTTPLSDTSGNFIRCVPLAVPLLWLGWQHMTAAGALYAVLSGAVASGLGYAVWYAALPLISRATSAYIQLTVPIIAAVGAVLLLGESLTLRLLLASAGILGGVALALTAAEARRARGLTPPGP